MDQRDYVAWLSEIDELSTEQRVEKRAVCWRDNLPGRL